MAGGRVDAAAAEMATALDALLLAVARQMRDTTEETDKASDVADTALEAYRAAVAETANS